MRVLFFYCPKFELETFRKGHPEAPDDERRIDCNDAVVCLVHGEPGDASGQVTKLIKNAKWIAKKFTSKRVVLHFFAHLGEEKCSPEEAQEMLMAAKVRLEASDYEVELTPFGYFCSLNFFVHGESLAKIFKAF